MTEDKPTNEPNVEQIESEPMPEAPQPSAMASTESTPPSPILKKSFKEKLRQFWHTKKGKATVIILVILLIAGTLYAIPTTRYGILGTFMKKNVSITVMDATTMKPVTKADITVGSYTAKTNNKGEATVSNVPVGQYTLKVAKKYYKDSTQSYEVPVFAEASKPDVHLVATGRQTVVSVVNKITNVPIAKATVTLSDTSAITDEQGTATLVLPADKKTVKATISGDGYNQIDTDIQVGGQTMDAVALTPEGELFYLSKQTGKINVMKSNLDGTGAKVVVEGTGNENDRETVLLSARDWKYMALSAKRDTSKTERIYLVNAASGSLATIDEGSNVSYQLVGWAHHRFIYIVYRNNRNAWENGQQALKSYDADTGKVTMLDETTSQGTNQSNARPQSFSNPYIVDNRIVYGESWTISDSSAAPTDRKPAIVSVNADGSNKQILKEFANVIRYSYVEGKTYAPQEIYFRVNIDGAPSTFYEYEDGAIKSISMTDDKFSNSFYATYLLSPNGQKTFWDEPRDGKNTLFTGDKNGQNSNTIASKSEFAAYGWYSDNYLLLSKNGSELYIAPADKPVAQPLKITDYHKPTLRFPGYGSGYGGI